MGRANGPKVAIAGLALGALLAACSGDYGSDTASQQGGSGGGGGDAPTLTVEAPANNANVTQPFALKFKSSEELGKTDTGKHHVHVVIDGKSADYTVVEGNQFQVKGLTPGKHTIDVTLQNADHSPAGAATKLAVNVTGGPGGQPSEDSGGDYGGGGGGY